MLTFLFAPTNLVGNSYWAISSGKLDSTGISEASKFLQATPFLLAAFYYLLSPFFIQQTRRRLTDYFEKINAEYVGPKDPVPPHLSPEAIGATADWIIDAPQVVPTLLLPLAGAVFSLHDNSIAGIIVAFAAVIVCVATLWMYTRSPIEYQARRFIWHTYSLVSVVGIILNLLVGIILLAV